MAALGTDYAALARSQSTDSNVSEGRLSQEPVNRTQVEKVAAPEIARNVRMMFETGQIQDLHEVKKTVASLDEPTGSGVFENEPVQLEGVVRSGEYVNDVEALQKGQTKNLLNQWKDKGKEEFKAEKKPINLAEDEGRMLENEPVRRSDVVREEDTDDAKDLPSKGQAKILTQQWISRKDDFLKEQKPIKLFENETEPSVVENQPEVRMDVLREDDNLEEIWLRKGFTKDLAGYWSGPKEEVRAARDAIDLGQEKDGVIAENQPTKLEGVIRADDPAEEVLPIEKGRAKTMVSRWLTMPEEAAKQPFQLDVNPHEAGVYENEPIQLEGVVKCTAQVDDVLGQKGMIKNISGRFLQQEEEPRNRKEMIVIDKAEGPSILENDPEPVRADVVRSEYGVSDEVQVEKGTTKNLVHKWKTQDLDQTSPRQNMDRTDPSWILQGAEKAAESGVFENQPQARADVFREAAYEPEVISVAETRNMRALWSKMGQDDGQKPAKGPEVGVHLITSSIVLHFVYCALDIVRCNKTEIGCRKRLNIWTLSSWSVVVNTTRRSKKLLNGLFM